MQPISFTCPAPIPAISTASHARPSRSRRGFRVFRVSPRAVAMTADIPASEEPKTPQSVVPPERDALLMDPEDREFVEWAVRAEGEVLDDEEPLVMGTLLEVDPLVEGIRLGGKKIQEDDDDDDDEEDENDDDNEEEEEDAELAARVGDDEFDDDVSLQGISKRGGRMRTPPLGPLGGVEEDVNDDIQDVEEIMEPIVDDIAPIFEQSSRAGRGTAKKEEQEIPDIPPGIDVPDDDIFGTETDEEIRNAAEILSKSGILGIAGVDSSKRYRVGLSKTEDIDMQPALADEDYVNDLPLGLEEDEDSLENEDKKGSLDLYVDTDSYDDDEEFALTSKSSFGRVWELNDDNYVTITEPGQSYVYEMDEEDQEDQEMSTMRRGKAGGWSGGLASFSSAELPKGSREWVARRAYELIAQSNQVEMFQWTRRHQSPPPIIEELYPRTPPPPPRLPKTQLEFSSPETSTPIIGKDSSGQNDDDEEGGLRSGINYKHALDKSINFPCQYKFKIEGSGADLTRVLAADLERVLGRPVSGDSFQVEPSGRYMRVEMMVDVESALQVTEVYDALRNNPAVRVSFG